jgi:hypothetical protein
METLLAQTPVPDVPFPDIPVDLQIHLKRFKVGKRARGLDSEARDRDTSMTENDIPLIDAKMVVVPGERIIVDQSAPVPGQTIFIQQQVPASASLARDYADYISGVEKRDKNTRYWEASQKEPLVEIPVKRTKQYFAIIQEMEEYDEKRAAKALDGVDGRTMTEKEEGVKMFERFFGGLRSLGERENFQGTPPWEQEISEEERKSRLKQAKKARLHPAANINFADATASSITPTEAFRFSNATDLASIPAAKVETPKERVIWRFEDVSWVKQRMTRPRKRSYAGTLTQRVQLLSGVERYGPFGIGSGIEGVGGVKQVIERGLDGNLRLGQLGREKPRERREIIV